MRTSHLPPLLREQDKQTLARARRGLGGSVTSATGAGVMLATAWARSVLGDDGYAEAEAALQRGCRAEHGLTGAAWAALVLALNAPLHGAGHRAGASLGQATGRTLRGLRAAGRDADAGLLEHRAMAWLGAYDPAAPTLARLVRTMWRWSTWIDYEQMLVDLIALSCEPGREYTLRDLSDGIWGRAVRPDDDPEELASTRAIAEAVGRSVVAVGHACREGLLLGAVKRGAGWHVPPRYLDPEVYGDAVQAGRRQPRGGVVDTPSEDE